MSRCTMPAKCMDEIAERRGPTMCLTTAGSSLRTAERRRKRSVPSAYLRGAKSNDVAQPDGSLAKEPGFTGDPHQAIEIDYIHPLRALSAPIARLPPLSHLDTMQRCLPSSKAAQSGKMWGWRRRPWGGRKAEQRVKRPSVAAG